MEQFTLVPHFIVIATINEGSCHCQAQLCFRHSNEMFENKMMEMKVEMERIFFHRSIINEYVNRFQQESKLLFLTSSNIYFYVCRKMSNIDYLVHASTDKQN